VSELSIGQVNISLAEILQVLFTRIAAVKNVFDYPFFFREDGILQPLHTVDDVDGKGWIALRCNDLLIINDHAAFIFHGILCSITDDKAI
jgi:hypothetical protein